MRKALTLTLVISGIMFSYGQTERGVDQTVPSAESEEIWRIVDVPPSFPGGIRKFYEHIGKNLKYPEDAKKAGIEGKVMVEFVIDSTGVIRPGSVNILKSLYKSCDEEAIRVISESPPWIPGRITARNKNVPVRTVLPINFKQ